MIGYLSCDPATLARDVRAALDAGWPLGALRAFDAFPMTHHVECVASCSSPPAHRHALDDDGQAGTQTPRNP